MRFIVISGFVARFWFLNKLSGYYTLGTASNTINPSLMLFFNRSSLLLITSLIFSLKKVDTGSLSDFPRRFSSFFNELPDFKTVDLVVVVEEMVLNTVKGVPLARDDENTLFSILLFDCSDTLPWRSDLPCEKPLTSSAPSNDFNLLSPSSNILA